MLRLRIITAAVALPILLATVLYGHRRMVQLLFIAVVGLSFAEVARLLTVRLEQLVGKNSDNLIEARWWDWIDTSGAIGAFVIFMTAQEDLHLPVIVAYVTVVLMLQIITVPNLEIAVARSIASGFAFFYGVLPWYATWRLFELSPRGWLMLLLLVIVWSGDTGAYFGGRLLGRWKLAPSISPNKTIEGALVGFLSSILGALVFFHLWPRYTSTEVLVMAVAGGIAGQAGDLVESAIKRFARAKDSGAIFPGHGGFLDRTDGLLMAAPVIWFCLAIMEGS